MHGNTEKAWQFARVLYLSIAHQLHNAINVSHKIRHK
jgi:hypothetical protein